MTAARSEVLARIRSALGPDRRPPVVPREYVGVSGNAGEPAPDVLDLLVERLQDYKAVVHRTSPTAVADTVAAAVGDADVRRLVCPAGVPTEWLSALDDVEMVGRTDVVGDEPPLTLAELDACDGVVTGCRVAVAQTGTLVLDAGADQGRRALSLVPDWHLCILRSDQVVLGVPDGLARLDPVRPLTLISGPSATSDIELERVEGVHGPRTLVVVLVEGPVGRTAAGSTARVEATVSARDQVWEV